MSNSNSIAISNYNVLDVCARLAEQAIWRAEHAEEECLLYTQLRELDVDNPRNRVHARAIISEIQRIEWKIVKEPLEIDPDTLNKIGIKAYREQLAIQFASLTNSERILWLDNLRFFRTPDVREIERKINTLRTRRTFGQQRCFLIGGPSGMGKTVFLEWYYFKNSPVVQADRNYVPVIKIQAPVSQRSTRALFRRIVRSFGKVYTSSADEDALQDQAVIYIYACGTETLLVDEVEHIKTAELKRRFLEFSNEAKRLVIVCASCRPLKWLIGDVELAGRYDDHHILEPYKGERLITLLGLIGLILPFPQESDLLSPDALTFIEDWSRGILREITTLIQDAALTAIHSGASCITLELLKQSAANIKKRSAEEAKRLANKRGKFSKKIAK